MRRCRYCAFVSTVPKHIPADDFTQAIIRELLLQKSLYDSGTLLTVYFGGGTPTMLPDSSLEQILSAIFKNFRQPQEITLEANPEHVTKERAETWKKIGINRVSLGIQAFDDELLKILGRNHSACQARKSVEILKNAGFDDLSIDLIYGCHCADDSNLQSITRWHNELRILNDIQPAHLSCYELTLEEHTPLWTLSKHGTQILCEESVILEMMRMIPDQSGMKRYEISNYSRNNYYSAHNLSCWAGLPYLGIGPGAHSFQKSQNGFYRWANTNLVRQWMTSLNQDHRQPIPLFKEQLSAQSHLAERLICAARTQLPWNPSDIARQIHAEINPYMPGITKAIQHGLLSRDSENPDLIITTPKGIELNNLLDEMIFEGFDEPS